MGCVLGVNVDKLDPNDVDLRHFEVVRVVGRGGFGKVSAVKKLTEPRKGEMFAMKAMEKKHFVGSKKHLDFAWIERDVLSKTKSRFVLNLHWSFQDKTSIYLIMDFMRGGDLSYYLSQFKKMDEDTCSFYSAEIMLGLEDMHRHNMVYRDLKPANVLLDERGHARLSDFGIACILEKDEGHMTTGSAGTQGYQAPEVIDRKPYNHSVDVFSFGITLYQLLRGTRPFKDNKEIQTLKCVPSTFKGVSADAKDLILKLMAPDVKDRIGCGSEMWDEVKRHPFYKGIDWEKLSKYELKPPFQPDVERANFPVDYELEDLLLSTKKEPVTDAQQEMFKGFEYNAYATTDSAPPSPPPDNETPGS